MKREDLYHRSFRGENGFNEFVSALGGDPISITEKVGLPPSLPKGLIKFESFAKTCHLFEESAMQTNEPYLGFKWAFQQPADFRFSGPQFLLLTMSRNARQWIDLALNYQKIHTNGMSFRYEEDLVANTVTGVISIHPLAPPCRQMVELFVACFALILRQFIPDFKFKLITFQHSTPKDMTLYEKVFQCPVTFNAERITIVADHHYIELKKTNLITKMVSPLVKKYVNWHIVKQPKAEQSMSMVMTETIPLMLGVKGSDIQHAAEALNLHPKKLQRLLSEEGTNYSQLLDNVRKNMAARILTESDISIIRLARMLDYSSDRPFTTAAKRWFGMSATEYRQHVRSI